MTQAPTTEIDEGGPAFPQYQQDPWHRLHVLGGMTLRDYFAAHALAGLLASGPHDCEAPGVAHDAYLFADAMLAARKPPQQGEG